MSWLELPHTTGCLVCGRDNPHGLHLSSFVDPQTNTIHTRFTPQVYHIGFEGIIHGGIIATVMDELMVWCAIWTSGRACVAGELSLRFRQKATVGKPLTAVARLTRHRSRLIETTAELLDGPTVLCVASGKYAPLGPQETTDFFTTCINEPQTQQAKRLLQQKFAQVSKSN